ncbi:hypothetical protein NPIL_309291 [Nephila pilipes]|uniref:Uncharacterized protein n=1 Tax=Nephila pilipes TaxID=299642 RepID=A0A8X6NZ66_NEPPI|nr:hypothetical protein NPIL_309291 [Nephila pilipes]
MTQVSIPEIQNLVNNLSNSDLCLHADTKIEEYLNSIPQIIFLNQEEKNEYSTHLYAIREEVRGKFNLFKSEEIRQKTEKYKTLINSWCLPDAARPQIFQHQSRRKNNTPIKKPVAKKQRTTPDATECQNRFQTLAIEKPVEEIEVDETTDEDVTPAPPILSYACAIWGNTTQANINKLQIQQNRALGFITGAPTFIPRKILHDELNVDSILQLIQKLATNFYNTLENHENPTISSLSTSTTNIGTRKPPASSQNIQMLF